MTIYRNTNIGNNVQIGDNTVVGKQPMVAATSTLLKRGDLTGKEQPPIITSNRCTR